MSLVGSLTARLIPSRRVLAYVVSVTIPLALVVMSLKVHKLLSTETRLGVWAVLVGVLNELLFVLLWLVLWTMVLEWSRGRARHLVAIALHTIGWMAIVLAVAEHIFFVKTGTVVSWFMTVYAAKQLHDLDRVLWSEIGWSVGVAGALVLVIGAIPVLLRRFTPLRRWLADETPVVDHASRTGLVGTAAITSCIGLAIGLAACDSITLRQNVAREPLVAMGVEAVGSVFASQAEAGSSSAVGLVDPLVIGPGPRTQPYNVVIIVMESVRAMSTTMSTPTLPTTPFLDHLSRTRGRHVERAYTVVPHTSKALVATLCGIYPKVVTPVVEATRGGIPTRCLAEALRSQGYATAFFQPAEERFEQRFLLVQNMGYETFKGKESIARPGFDESSYFGYEDDIMIEPAMEWVDQQTQPFLLTFLTLTSHHTYRVPRGFPVQRYSDSSRLDDYLNTVRYTDRFVEKLHAQLDERGLLDRTIFIVLGDHGEGFGEHGRFEHDTSIYEEGIHIPLVIAGPGTGTPGTPIAGLRQITDVVPTVLDALGLEVRSGLLAGRSLLGPPHDRISTSCWYHNYCMARLEGTRKIIYHFNNRATEVFDLAEDPEERHDLAGQSSPEELHAVEKALLAWRTRANARYLAQLQRSEGLLVQSSLPPVQHPLDVRFGDIARLRGYDIVSTRVPTGRDLELTLYFEALRSVSDDWELFVHIVDKNGRMVRSGDHIPAEGSHPIRDWSHGEFVIDPFAVFIQHGTKPGRYRIAVGFWRRGGSKDAARSRIELSGDGAEIADDRRVWIGEFEIVPGNRG